MTQWEGERWLITIFPVEKCTFSLSWAKKTDYEIRNIKFIVHIFLFLGGGEEGEREGEGEGGVGCEECDNSSPVPNLYLRSIVMNSPLNF